MKICSLLFIILFSVSCNHTSAKEKQEKYKRFLKSNNPVMERWLSVTTDIQVKDLEFFFFQRLPIFRNAPIAIIGKSPGMCKITMNKFGVSRRQILWEIQQICKDKMIIDLAEPIKGQLVIRIRSKMAAAYK